MVLRLMDKSLKEKKTMKKIFSFSLIVLLALSTALSVIQSVSAKAAASGMVDSSKLITATPTKTPTITPTPTSVPASCDFAAFVKDVTYIDGSRVGPEYLFTKTWRVTNIGSCTWTKDYALVFSSGDLMGASKVIKLPAKIAPGTTVDFSIKLVAPKKYGYYSGSWMLRNASGDLFGVGPDGKQPLTVSIKVADLPIVYDMTSKYCDAHWWSSGVTTLACPAATEDLLMGFIKRISNPRLENNSVDNEDALLAYPYAQEMGSTRGEYPEYKVQINDHFRTIIGCQYDAKKCSVQFKLQYRIGSGDIVTYATWEETYDGKFHKVDVDLTPLAGKKVKFILTVKAHGSVTDNYALWLHPQIVR
jgi:hypothetical protein